MQLGQIIRHLPHCGTPHGPLAEHLNLELPPLQLLLSFFAVGRLRVVRGSGGVGVLQKQQVDGIWAPGWHGSLGSKV